MRGTRIRIIAPLAALALFGAACTGDDDSADDGAGEGTEATETEETDESEDTDGLEEPASTDETDETDEVDEVQEGDSTLATVRERGNLECGVNEELAGFGLLEGGEFTGFDVDFCKVVAAGVLGDAEAVEYTSLNADNRITALQNGEIDILIRNTTWTASRDGNDGLTFLYTTFFDGQGMMVPADSGLTTLEDLADANICVQTGTTTETNLTTIFDARGIPFNPQAFVEDSQVQEAYEAEQCEAWTADRSALSAWKLAVEESTGNEQFIMEEVMSKEPLGPVVRDGDSEWAQAAEWSVMATVVAWELELDSSNVGTYDGDDPTVLNFLGEADTGLGLDPDFAVNIVEQVGNYEEIYDRHLPAVGLEKEGTVNTLWTDGGLLYVPPYG